MKQRLLVAAVGVPLLILVLVFLPPLATGLLAAAIAGAAAYELLHTAGRNVPPFVYILTVVTAALTVLLCAREAVFSGLPAETAWTIYAVWAFLYVMALFLTAVCTHGLEKAMPFASVAVCIVAAFLFPAMYSAIARLRNIGPAFVLMPFVVAFIGDSFSMLGGMALGHKKFAPRVSPNKTWAGFLAGPVGSGLGMAVLCLVCRGAWSMTLPVWYFVLVGVLSLIKREAGIKDYSHIFLTHGGVLDRFDSILFIAPVVYAAVMGMEAVL